MKKSIRLGFLVILLLVIVSEGKVFSQNIDIRLLRAFNSPETLPSDNFFRFISNSDPYIVAGLPACIAAAGLIKHDNDLIRNSCVGLAATAVCGGLTIVLKYSVNRDRPFITYQDIKKKSDGGTPSFPSGHTSGAFATATSVSLAYPKWYVIVPSFTWAGTVGYSRMHLGVHYPSDVLAGALIGSGCAYLTFKINQKLLKSSRH
jgi:membrane-associated phospholipid phosphatase